MASMQIYTYDNMYWKINKNAKTRMCGIDQSFLTYEIEDQDLYFGTNGVKVTSSKLAIHEKIYFDNQHTFISMFNTFTFLKLEVLDHLQRV